MKRLFELRLAHCVVFLLCLGVLTGCAQAEFPGARTPDIPAAKQPYDKIDGINEGHHSVIRLPLGKDVLVPSPLNAKPLPDTYVGPFELRGETLGGALQLILADYDIAMAFETSEGLTRRITVANLRGKLSDVVETVCSLADLYCAYDDGILTIKDEETFMVDLPPFGVGSDGKVDTASFDQIASGLEAIVGSTATLDSNGRVLIYSATHRSNKYAKEYFRKMRKNTALIVFETHIWEVTLNNDNRTGIDWQGAFNNVGNFDFNINIPGAAPAGTASPITITPTFSGSGNLNFTAILQFISEHGAVKTVSQPQITVMSGSSAKLEVRQSENFVSEFTRTPSTVVGVADTVSTTTDNVETGLTMSIAGAWDESTIYGTLDIALDELLRIDNFSPSTDTIIQLPATTTRSLQTQIRVRPGDTILIAGLVTERDNYSGSGPGFLKPLFTTARSAKTKNTELVFMLKPRVIVFVDEQEVDAEIKKLKKRFVGKAADDSVIMEVDVNGGVLNEDAELSSVIDTAVTSGDSGVKDDTEEEQEKEYPSLSISPDLLAPRTGTKVE